MKNQNITDRQFENSVPGYVAITAIVLIFIGLVFLTGVIILLCYLIPIVIKYPVDTGVCFIGICMLIALFGIFNEPYPCKHSKDIGCVCNECEKLNK